MKISNLFDIALDSLYGIAVCFPTQEDLMRQRRRMYAVREKLRKAGRYQYDDLSFVAKTALELMIIKRQPLHFQKDVLPLYRHLTSDEGSKNIPSRGKSRLDTSIS